MLLEMKLHDARMDGREEGMIEAQAKERQSTALDMLKDKEPLIKIVKYSRLSEEEVYALAQANGLAVIE